MDSGRNSLEDSKDESKNEEALVATKNIPETIYFKFFPTKNILFKADSAKNVILYTSDGMPYREFSLPTRVSETTSRLYRDFSIEVDKNFGIDVDELDDEHFLILLNGLTCIPRHGTRCYKSASSCVVS